MEALSIAQWQVPTPSLPNHTLWANFKSTRVQIVAWLSSPSHILKNLIGKYITYVERKTQVFNNMKRLPSLIFWSASKRGFWFFLFKYYTNQYGHTRSAKIKHNFHWSISSNQENIKPTYSTNITKKIIKKSKKVFKIHTHTQKKKGVNKPFQYNEVAFQQREKYQRWQYKRRPQPMWVYTLMSLHSLLPLQTFSLNQSLVGILRLIYKCNLTPASICI